MKSWTNRPSRFLEIGIFCLIFATLLPASALSQDAYQFDRMWPTLQQPWYFQRCELGTDGKDFVYVADYEYKHIQKFTLNGQFITRWKGSGRLAANRDFVYVTNTKTHQIQKFTSDGAFVTQWGSQGNGDGEFASLDDVAVDAEGSIYVLDGKNHRVQKFAPDGKFVKKWGSQGSDDGEFETPNDMAADARGFVYVSDSGNTRIQKFTTDGEFVKKWGTRGSGDGEFETPNDIEADGQGFIYVSDSRNNRIQKFTADGEFENQWEGSSSFSVDHNGSIYKAGNANIKKFTSDGEFVVKWGSRGDEDGEFVSLYGIATDQNGFVYAVDNWNHCVQKFTSDGQFVAKWGQLGPRPGEFNKPYGVAVDNDGFVYVTETRNFRVQKFDSDGQFITRWGGKGSTNGKFLYPKGIAVDNDGFVYVVDTIGKHIQKFKSNGQFVSKWEGPFNSPNDIAVDDNGFVYVADKGSCSVHKFTSYGHYVRNWGPGINEGKDAFGGPMGIAVDNGGFVYVTDSTEHRVLKFTSDGEYVTKFGEFGFGPGMFNRMGLLGVSPTGKVYVSDFINGRLQVFKPSLPTDKKMKAIIVAGRKTATDPLWNATQMSANFAYRTLIHQGFTRESIFYLSANTDADLDSNGKADDVDKKATNENLRTAVTEWARDADSLVIYLTDHGGFNIFRMSENEMLLATDLDSWLDMLQEDFTGKVIIVYDACQSGSFISALTPPQDRERIIAASSSPDEAANFISQGTISFSNYFWTHIFNGLDVRDAFSLSDQAMRSPAEIQHPLLDADGDGTGSEPEDIELVRNVYIGNGRRIQGDAPTIESVSQDQTLTDTTTATLSAFGVADEDGIRRVWAVIRPPDYMGTPDDPIQDLPSVELKSAEDDEGRYDRTYSEFNTEGIYRIMVYAEDQAGNISIPKLTTVTVINPLKRRAIIVAGGSLAGELRTAIEHTSDLAYNTLISQGYGDDDIYFLAASAFSTRVDGLSGRDNLQYAIETWASEDTRDLVIYMVGNGQEDAFRVNDAGELLSCSDLDVWLDHLQTRMSGRVTVIYDACGSGPFVSSLTAPQGKERILIASAGQGQPASFGSDGTISFSQFFWNRIAEGNTLGNAFVEAKRAVRYLGRRSRTGQVPFMDDGHGLAENYVIGEGIMMAGDEPVIGSVPPLQTLDDGTATAVIRIEGVTATRPVVRVWGIIIPPTERSDSICNPVKDFPILELKDLGNGRYEGAYYEFCELGIYDVILYAKDADGNISMPIRAQVEQTIEGVTPDEPPPADEPPSEGPVYTGSELKTVIVAGGGPYPGNTRWDTTRYLANYAYSVLMIRGIRDEEIYYLSPDTTLNPDGGAEAGEVDSEATYAHLKQAITDWAKDADNVLIYLTGNGGEGGFEINESESLGAEELDAWLDTLQEIVPGKVIFVYDACSGGAFLPSLVPPDGTDRILIGSTCGDPCPSLDDPDMPSFSTFFWRQVDQGANMKDAFINAETSVGLMSGISGVKQSPCLNDNGNSVANEADDGESAQEYVIGTGMLRPAGPSIGSVSPSQTLNGESSSAALWAEDVTAAEGIEHVLAIVIPPGEDIASVPLDDLPVLELISTESGRYQAVYEDFSAVGSYQIVIYAMDKNGNFSQPLITQVEQTVEVTHEPPPAEDPAPSEDEIDPPEDDPDDPESPIDDPDPLPSTDERFSGGGFTVGEQGIVEFEWLYDGGMYEGELGIFSLSGMEDLTPGSEAFIREAARRALSNSETDGYVLFSDPSERARFTGSLGGEPQDWNQGPYRGVRRIVMKPGETFASILVPNASMESLFNDPGTTNPYKRPLFSLVSSNPAYGMYMGQVADVNGLGRAFVYEDIDALNSDFDFNDLIFQVTGAVADNIPTLDALLDALQSADGSAKRGRSKHARRDWIDWRVSTELGREIIQHVESSDTSPETLWISAATDSSLTDLLLYDDAGNVMGKAGGEIPGAIFGFDNDACQFLRVPAREDGTYRLILRSAADERCHVTIKSLGGISEILSAETMSVEMQAHQVLKSDIRADLQDDMTVDFTSPQIPLDAEACPLFFDFNGDGNMDEEDIGQISSRWNTVRGDAEYDPFYDLDDDGTISILDIMAVVNSR